MAGCLPMPQRHANPKVSNRLNPGKNRHEQGRAFSFYTWQKKEENEKNQEKKSNRHMSASLSIYSLMPQAFDAVGYPLCDAIVNLADEVHQNSPYYLASRRSPFLADAVQFIVQVWR